MFQPGIPRSIGSKLGEVAVKAAQAVNYVGAGSTTRLSPQFQSSRVLFFRNCRVCNGRKVELLLHGNEHSSPGGTPHHRNGHRARLGRVAVQSYSLFHLNFSLITPVASIFKTGKNVGGLLDSNP